MQVHLSLHLDHNQEGVVGRAARNLGTALNWLSGPAMSEQERQERDLAEVRNLKHDVSALHL